jgi:serine/threonine protein kinase
MIHQNIIALEALIACQDTSAQVQRHARTNQLTAHHGGNNFDASDANGEVSDPASMFTFDASSSDNSHDHIADAARTGGGGQRLDNSISHFLSSSDWVVLRDLGTSQAPECADDVCRCVATKGTEDLVQLGCGLTSVVVKGRLQRRTSSGHAAHLDVAVRCAVLNWEHVETDEAVYEDTSADIERKTVLHRFRHEMMSTQRAMSCHAKCEKDGGERVNEMVYCYGYNIIASFSTDAVEPDSAGVVVGLLDLTRIIPPHQQQQLRSVVILSVHELATGGTLAAKLAEIERFSPICVRDILLDVTRGLVHLHEVCGLVHGDVKPMNILAFPSADSSWRWKLTDLGLSQPLAASVSSSELLADGVGGTAMYMSPNACRGHLHASNDVWSVGIMGIQLLTGRVPWAPLEAQFPAILYSGLRSIDPATMIRPQLYEVVQIAKRESGVDSFSSKLAEVLLSCLDEAHPLTSDKLLARLNALA